MGVRGVDRHRRGYHRWEHDFGAVDSPAAWPRKLERVQEVEVPWRVPALGEVASELAAVLRYVVHDVGDDQPSRPREVRAHRQRRSQRRIVQGLHVAPQAGEGNEVDVASWPDRD